MFKNWCFFVKKKNQQHYFLLPSSVVSTWDSTGKDNQSHFVLVDSEPKFAGGGDGGIGGGGDHLF